MQLVMKVRVNHIRKLFASALLGGTVLLAGCANDNAASRGQIDLIASFTKTADTNWPYLNSHDTTASICGPITNCVQAVSSDYVTVLKFRSPTEARAYVDSLGTSGVQVDPLVIHFDGKATSDQARQEVVDAVSSINADSPD
jgi:hypothetical protein